MVSGGFDDLRARHLRFLEEASRFGELTVLLWPDETLHSLTGRPPKFPLAERLYFLNAVRYVSRVIPLTAPADVNTLPKLTGCGPKCGWMRKTRPTQCGGGFASSTAGGIVCCRRRRWRGFRPGARTVTPGRKKVVVTGCYDWFHSGHVRFFEEASAYGDPYVIVGHDANIRLLKGEGHPLLPQEERRYVVGSIKYVKQAMISSGEGWLDADPEIRRLNPDIYAVNEDGDRGGKREYCRQLGIEYLVLKRLPAPGLPKRTSTDLRGF